MLASFSFAHPWVLLALAVPILLVWWEIARRGHEVALPLDHGKQRRGAPWRVLVTWASLAPALLAAVAAVILAGPQLQGSPERVRRLTNIEICLDVSGSMTADLRQRSAALGAAHEGPLGDPERDAVPPSGGLASALRRHRDREGVALLQGHAGEAEGGRSHDHPPLRRCERRLERRPPARDRQRARGSRHHAALDLRRRRGDPADDRRDLAFHLLCLFGLRWTPW